MTARVPLLAASDGVRLRAALFGAGAAAVAFSHMGRPGDTEDDWRDPAARLAKRGYVALIHNRRGVCDRDGTRCSSGTPDLRAARRRLPAHRAPRRCR